VQWHFFKLSRKNPSLISHVHPADIDTRTPRWRSIAANTEIFGNRTRDAAQIRPQLNKWMVVAEKDTNHVLLIPLGASNEMPDCH